MDRQPLRMNDTRNPTAVEGEWKGKALLGQLGEDRPAEDDREGEQYGGEGPDADREQRRASSPVHRDGAGQRLGEV